MIKNRAYQSDKKTVFFLLLS